MTDHLNALKSIRYSQPEPPFQYPNTHKESSFPWISTLVGLILFLVAGFQQYQIIQLNNGVQNELVQLKSQIETTNQKADAALEAIKQTQDQQKLCSMPVIGSWLCTLSELRRQSN